MKIKRVTLLLKADAHENQLLIQNPFYKYSKLYFIITKFINDRISIKFVIQDNPKLC